MILHLIQKSPFENSALSNCLDVINKSDSILLMQDGIYALQQDRINHLSNRLYALDVDINARGIHTTNTNFTPINYSEFVALCSQHKQTISWF